MVDRLHLIGEDEDDLKVVSALLQDAAVLAGDVGYDAPRRRLALIANRYRWEAKQRTRVRAALTVGGVMKVQRKGWPADGATVLDLLALRRDGEALLLDFAGGPSLRLEVECVDLLLEDITDPWGAGSTPRHEA
jgi:hypothetical protein